MYLLYDVIQRRKAALGNSLLAKRGDYEAVQETISSLTHEQLLAAAQSLRVSQTTSDPAIAILRRSIQAVAARVPNSFAQKADMRLHIRRLFIEFGPPAFWLTIILMLHLHGFVWLTGNVDFLSLREKILDDLAFSREMIEYFDSIISEYIDPCESEVDYMNALRSYGNDVVSKQQMHSRSHNSTCFKYSKKGTRQCRFNYTHEASHFDDLGAVM
jgi:hypothetical protein